MRDLYSKRFRNLYWFLFDFYYKLLKKISSKTNCILAWILWLNFSMNKNITKLQTSCAFSIIHQKIAKFSIKCQKATRPYIRLHAPAIWIKLRPLRVPIQLVAWKGQTRRNLVDFSGSNHEKWLPASLICSLRPPLLLVTKRTHQEADPRHITKENTRLQPPQPTLLNL